MIFLFTFSIKTLEIEKTFTIHQIQFHNIQNKFCHNLNLLYAVVFRGWLCNDCVGATEENLQLHSGQGEKRTR